MAKILGPLIFAILFAVFFKAQNFLVSSEVSSKVTQQDVRVLAYSSFLSHFGPAQLIKRGFEATSNCNVKYEDVGDAGLLLNKLRLSPEVDVVVGLDQLTIHRAQKLFQWKKVDWDSSSIYEAVRKLNLSPFVPFDWSPLSFVYRPSQVESQRLKSPKSFLLKPEPQKPFKVTVPHPKYSTTGAHFVYWLSKTQNLSSIKKIKQNLSSKVQFYTDWSQSYGLFLRKQVHVSWSQMTSKSYHLQQGDLDIGVIDFEQPHPYQVEFAGVPENCKNCECATHFVKYLLSDTAQKELQKKNYMIPVSTQVELQTNYHSLMTLPLMEYDNLEALSEFTDQIDTDW